MPNRALTASFIVFSLFLVGSFLCLTLFSKNSEAVLSKSSLISNKNLRGSRTDQANIHPTNHISKMSRSSAIFPTILYGTAWKKNRTKELVEIAVRNGFRGIDTACQPKHYYEPGVGEALSTLYAENVISRGDIFLQTKFTSLNGQDPNNIPYDKNLPLREQVLSSFQVSLRNLKTDYLDSLVLHSPMPRMKDTLIAWKTFEEIYKTGAVLRLGLSNTYDLSVLRTVYDAAEIKPTILQNRFYRDSGYDVEIREFCRANGIDYQSFWTLTGNPDIVKSKVVSRIAQKYNKTREQVWFKFVRSLGVTPLSGTTSQEHMREDLEVESMEALTAEEMTEIQQLLD